MTVIDMDRIDVTNLNRQFLFRMGDRDKPKAQVAAEFIMKRFKDVKVEYHCKRIQEFGIDFYDQFHIIIGGLDNVEARRWMNATLHSMVQFDENKKPIMTSVKVFFLVNLI